MNSVRLAAAPPAVAISASEPVRAWRGENLAVSAARRLLANRFAVTALVFLLIVVVAAVGAPVLAPYKPLDVQPSAAMAGPSAGHWLGTDRFGRDIFSRVMYGGQLTLQVAFVSVIISALIGVAFGLLAGYSAGSVDAVIMRLVDVLLAFPGILLALVVVAVLQPGLNSIIIAVGISGIPYFVRVARASTLSVRHEPYVEAARVSGCSGVRIVLRHILPNVIAPILVLITVGAANAVLVGASLSFLGLGVAPPAPEWGAMMNAGRDYLREAPWLINGPGVVLMLTVLAISTLGDGLRDALDPRLRGA
jgi:peptide/nickel transport system permease protein